MPFSDLGMQGVALEPENLVVSAGCGAIINDLLYCVTNPGEAVTVPAPYYPAFDNDIKVTICCPCFAEEL